MPKKYLSLLFYDKKSKKSDFLGDTSHPPAPTLDMGKIVLNRANTAAVNKIVEEGK